MQGYSWLPPSWRITLQYLLIRLTAPQHADPSPKPVLCTTSRVALATESYRPVLRYRRCLNPLWFLHRAARPRLVHAVPPGPRVYFLAFKSKDISLAPFLWIERCVATVACSRTRARRDQSKRFVRSRGRPHYLANTRTHLLACDHFSSTHCCCSSPQRLLGETCYVLACA
jgi:hypothetical protein